MAAAVGGVTGGAIFGIFTMGVLVPQVNAQVNMISYCNELKFISLLSKLHFFKDRDCLEALQTV